MLSLYWIVKFVTIVFFFLNINVRVDKHRLAEASFQLVSVWIFTFFEEREKSRINLWQFQVATFAAVHTHK